MLQTKVTNDNWQDFYKNIYFMQSDSRDSLVDLDEFDTPCVIVDCCGGYYKTLFDKHIIVLETVKSAKNFNFSKNQFDKLIDNRDDNNVVWPTITVENPVLIFDRSPLLKYLSINALCNILSNAAEKYQAKTIVVRHHLFFLDDTRLSDRFYNFYNFKIKNYSVEKFVYDTTAAEYYIQLKKNYNV